jgi:Fe-S-cluster formation regulator IscX/YfhJ
MVSRYRRASWVLYSPMNEPSYITWQEWRPVAERLTDLVHSINPDAVTFVSGVDWAHDISGVLQDPVRRPNVVYEVHAYPENQRISGTNWQNSVVQLALRYPVFIGEWGYVETSQAATLAPADRFLIGGADSYAQPLLALADRLQLGWTPFIYSQHWIPRLIEYRSTNVELLTLPGIVVREALYNRYHSGAQYARLWQDHAEETLRKAPLRLNLDAAKSMRYDEAHLRLNIRSSGYNQLYVELKNLGGGTLPSPVETFAFKFGFEAKPRDLGLEFRLGDGISQQTTFNANDKYGKALFLTLARSVRTRIEISGMTDRDQQVLAFILQNSSRIIKDAVERAQELSPDDRAFWMGNLPLFDSKAQDLLRSLESPAWNPR